MWRNRIGVIFAGVCIAGAFLVCVVLPGDLILLPWQRVDVNSAPTTRRELGTVISVKLVTGTLYPIKLATISYGEYTAEVTAPQSVRVGDTVEVTHSVEHPALIARVRIVGSTPSD
jgi:hypothetical protein